MEVVNRRGRRRWCRLAFRLGCWLLLAGLVVGPAHGQPAPDWQPDPVLSPLLIQQMVTDAAGLRWVATDDGVYRYDGAELVPLQKLVRQGPRLAVEMVTALAFDRAGRLWLGTASGLARFDPATGQLRAVPLPLRPDERPNVAALLYHPRTHHLWVGYGAGTVAVVDALDPQAPHFPVRRVPETAFYFTAEAGGDGVWLASDHPALYQLGPTGAVRRQFPVPTLLLPVPGTQPQRFLGRQGLFVLDAADHLQAICRWPRQLPQLAYAPYATDSTLDAVGQGQWWHVADVRGARPRLFMRPVPGQAPGYMLERDAAGIWWRYARDWRGCYKQRQVRQVVEPVLRASGAPAGSARLITRLPDGRLFVSTYGGCFTQAADSPQAPLRPFRLGKSRGNAPYNGVFDGAVAAPAGGFAVLADELWVVARLDVATGRVSNLAGGPMQPWRRETIGPPHALALLRDHAGRVWVGGAPGLFRVGTDYATVMRVADDQPDWPLHKLDISGLAEDPATGALWVSTNRGLYWLPPSQPARLQAYGVDAPTGRWLPTEALTCVAAAGPGRAWVGTRDQGLLLVDAHRGLLRQLSTSAGLPSHTITTVLPDHSGNVWAGTYAGLVRYDPGRGRLSVFGEAEGLQNPELNRWSAFADADGTHWFGGVGGVYRVLPGRAQTGAPLHSPRLLLTAVGTPAGETEAVHYLPSSGSVPRLTLAAGPQAFVELQLALTEFFAPGLVRYAYRLHHEAEAHPTAWLYSPRRLVLRGLAPGNYEVEIRAETAAGQAAANHLRLPLHVEARWWQWPLVWALAASLLVALGYGAYWLRLRRGRREAARRVELAANLHDEVGALLTRVSLLAEVLSESHPATEPDLRAARPDTRYALDRLLYNSRAAVQTMRDVVWGIDAQADSVAALLDRMREHLSQTAAAAGLQVALHADLSEKVGVPAGVRQHLYLVFKEAVTNAVRHARGATKIRAYLGRRQGRLVLEVSDDGQGAGSPAPRASGMGLRNMARRAQAMGATLHTGPHADGRPGYCVRLTLDRA